MLEEATEIFLDNREKVLRILHAKREWEQTFDAVPDLIFIVDADQAITRVNSAMAERCGCAPRDMIGRKCFEVLFNTLIAPDGWFRSTISDDTHQPKLEFEINKLNGIFEISMSPVKNEQGQIAAYVHIARDITEKKRRDELLESQQNQLEEINNTLETRIETALAELRKKDDFIIQQGRLSAMSEMISSIAHQWRQPLNTIGLIVQGVRLAFLQNDLSEEELNRDVADTMNTLQQISKTIDEFRSFFSTEREVSNFYVDDIINQSIAFIGPALKSQGIRMEHDLQPDVQTTGFPSEYMQVILNIILNARDALIDRQQDAPTIKFTVSEENGHSIVTISDNGGGISADVLPKIFDPYFTTKRNTNSGIGLYMAKMIIEKKMYGSLTARNIEGGAEFRIEV